MRVSISAFRCNRDGRRNEAKRIPFALRRTRVWRVSGGFWSCDLTWCVYRWYEEHIYAISNRFKRSDQTHVDVAGVDLARRDHESLVLNNEPSTRVLVSPWGKPARALPCRASGYGNFHGSDTCYPGRGNAAHTTTANQERRTRVRHPEAPKRRIITVWAHGQHFFEGWTDC